MEKLVFKDFAKAVRNRIGAINPQGKKLFYQVDISKDDLWAAYMNAFPAGTNETFVENRAYECTYCMQFIKKFGNVVTINNGKTETIWDVTVPGYYQVVADKMKALVEKARIRDVYVTSEKLVGVEKNKSGNLERPATWYHFYHILPKSYLNTSGQSNAEIRGDYRSLVSVFKRALTELKEDAIETVTDLIAHNSLPKGDSFGALVNGFLMHLKEFNKLSADEEKDNYCWGSLGRTPESIMSVRNSAIGTLMVDLSEDVDLDIAVRKYETKVAGDNYKRPKPLVTKKAKENAIKKIDELGLRDSLARRYAVTTDISINDVLFVDRTSAPLMKGNPLDDLEVSTTPISKNRVLNNVKEMDIEDFLENVLPNSTSVELFLENTHEKNFVSLIAPQNPGTPSLFKWDNGFSWSYKGNYTESLKDHVQALGGKVDGVLRYSISWFNNDDYDAHAIEPSGTKIYFSNTKNPRTLGNLDVDIQDPKSERGYKGVVENITWPKLEKMEEGEYIFKVHNYARKPVQDRPGGFIAELECMGKLFRFEYKKEIPNKGYVTVAKIRFTKKDGISIVSSLPTTVETKEIWGVKTNNFVKVKTIMRSPNYWENETPVLSKHTMFMLEGCKNDSSARGFYNEFLKQDLVKEKRVFEALGEKMRVEDSDDQLSGVGFSSTQRNSVLVKVKGSFERVLKLNI